MLPFNRTTLIFFLFVSTIYFQNVESTIDIFGILETPRRMYCQLNCVDIKSWNFIWNSLCLKLCPELVLLMTTTSPPMMSSTPKQETTTTNTTAITSSNPNPPNAGTGTTEDSSSSMMTTTSPTPTTSTITTTLSTTSGTNMNSSK